MRSDSDTNRRNKRHPQTSAVEDRSCGHHRGSSLRSSPRLLCAWQWPAHRDTHRLVEPGYKPTGHQPAQRVPGGGQDTGKPSGSGRSRHTRAALPRGIVCLAVASTPGSPPAPAAEATCAWHWPAHREILTAVGRRGCAVLTVASCAWQWPAHRDTCRLRSTSASTGVLNCPPVHCRQRPAGTQQNPPT